MAASEGAVLAQQLVERFATGVPLGGPEAAPPDDGDAFDVGPVRPI